VDIKNGREGEKSRKNPKYIMSLKKNEKDLFNELFVLHLNPFV
jgi:hypothetical protein